MSRGALRCTLVAVSFPRVSGDEPAPQRLRDANTKFSPRERG